MRCVPKVQLGRLFQREASAAREGYFNSRGEVTLAKEVKPDLGMRKRTGEQRECLNKRYEVPAVYLRL